MASQPKIVAYMKPVCGWSQGVRAVFAKYNLEYEDKDIVNDPYNYAEMVKVTGQYLQPSIKIGNDILPDMSGEEVEEYLLDRNIVQPISFEVVVEHGCTD
tara:strand:+ start:64 stop:363 length:300 start_codon:yes stop_codon:yes gene_type:complete